MKAWNADPVDGMTGDEFASVVHGMLLDLQKAVSIPLVVSRAAEGDYAPLEHAGSGISTPPSGSWVIDLVQRALGRARRDRARGAPTSTATRPRRSQRSGTNAAPSRSALSRASLWTLPTSSPVPVLALVGGADPQDPVTNLSDLKQHFPDSRTVIFPHVGHEFGIGGCVDQMMADFVDRGTTRPGHNAL